MMWELSRSSEVWKATASTPASARFGARGAGLGYGVTVDTSCYMRHPILSTCLGVLSWWLGALSH